MGRRLAAVLAADMVGFSRLMERDEGGTIARQKHYRESLIDPKIAQYGGRIVKTTGDGLLVEFPSAVDAVLCAAEVQQAMRSNEQDEPPETRIQYRVGVNVGDIVIQEDDILGDGVNVAARLEGLAEPGGLCISDVVHQYLQGKSDLGFTDLGMQSLKNLERQVRAWSWQPGQGKTQSPEVSAAKEKPSIAVLALDNMSGDREEDFLADGISEDLITALSKVRWLMVIARNSTFTYKGQAVDVKQVGRELGVRYVLEGSVRKAGNRVRVTVQLLDALTSHHVWAERYDREITDIFELQDEICQTIVGSLEPELSAAERERVRTKSPDSLDAWETYQRGLYHMWNYDLEGHPKARKFLEKATQLDPNFAPAHAYLSYVHYQSVIMGWAEDSQAALASGYALAQRALKIDDKDPLPYFASGRILMMRGEHDASIAALRRSIYLNPSFAQAHHGLGMALVLAGELEEAKQALEMAERLSPLDPILWASTVVHALADVLSGDTAQALEWAQKTLRNPRAKGYWPHAVYAAALVQAGRLEEAKSAVQDAVRELPGLSVDYLVTTLQTKHPGGLDPYVNNLRKAGLPE